MKRPAFQFYPADWRNNAKLRRCSWAARGVWIDVMSLMHDSEEYGILRWPLKEIAQAIGAPLPLLKELVDKDVLKGSDKQLASPLVYTPVSGRKKGSPVELISVQKGPIWYSSRMVTDEHVRQKKANHDLFKSSPHYSPMPPADDSGDWPPMPPTGDEGDKPPMPPLGERSDPSPMPPIGEYMGDAPMPPKSDLPSSSSVNYYLGGSSNRSQSDNGVERIGDLCKRLRRIGIMSSPASFQEPEWQPLLDRFSNDDIVTLGQTKRTAYPEKPMNAAYLIPALKDRLKQPTSVNGEPHASSHHASRNDRNAAILAEASRGYPGGGDVIEGSVRVVD